MNRVNTIFALLFLFSGTCFEAGAQNPGKLPPLFFRENKGQVGDQNFRPRADVLFSGNADGQIFHLRNNGISYQIQRIDTWNMLENDIAPHSNGKKITKKIPGQITIQRIDINWLNANQNFSLLKENELSGYENFYSVFCPQGATGVKSYGKITYQNIYKNVNVMWYEKNGKLKYDYLVAPGADYKQIQLEIQGAENISVNEKGQLLIQTPLGILTENAPEVKQNGKVFEAKWKLDKNIVSFEIEGVDNSKPLLIDPLVRLWGTYYGGTGDESFIQSDIDPAGNIYACGETSSLNNIATSGAQQIVFGGGPASQPMDAMLVKFDSNGQRLWATYYGGTGVDYAQDCDVNANGHLVALTGVSTSTNAGVISTPGAQQLNYLGGGDGFVVLFDENGTRQWGTYYGGPKYEWTWAVNFENNGDIVLAGTTSSTVGIASAAAYQPNFGGGDRDGFIVKYNGAGVLQWATYVGDVDWDYITGCSVDTFGNIIVCGYTESKNNIGTPGTAQPTLCAIYFGYGDSFIAKYNSAGNKLWGTYYGATGIDWAWNTATDAAGTIYVAGITNGAFPILTTPGCYQYVYGGGAWDSFLLKLDANGARQWCTFFGGKLDDNNAWCAYDPSGFIYVCGATTSTNGISTPCAYQTDYGGEYWPYNDPASGGDAYLAKFEPGGSKIWSTYYGGKGLEFANYCTCSLDQLGNVIMVGGTGSNTGTVMASAGSFQDIFGGGSSDAFMAKFDGCRPNATNITAAANMKICRGDTTVLAVSPSCTVTWFDAPTGGNLLANTSVFITPALNTNNTYYVNEATCGSNTVRTAITVTVNPLPVVSVDVPNTLLCYNANVNLNASGASSYSWSPNKWINCTYCPDPVVSPEETTQYCVVGADSNSCRTQTCITVEVNWAKDHDFSLPNAFTPNGDGNNDKFCLQGWDICNDEFLVRIFDRWGEKVFESDDPNFCWDGIYRGVMQNADVYAYSVSAKYKDGTKVNKKGNITLIK